MYYFRICVLVTSSVTSTLFTLLSSRGFRKGHTVLRHFFDVTEVFKSILKDIPALKTISGSGDADPLQNYSNFTK
jgi:hypothetical protein